MIGEERGTMAGTTNKTRIARATATPVALPIVAPRRHSDGVTEATVRTILQLETADGLVGLGEVGPRVGQEPIRALLGRLVGEDPFATERLRLRFSGGKFYSQDAASLFAAVEIACFDLQGQLVGRPVADLLGGRLREEIPLIAYVFSREATAERPAVATTDEIVAHARDLVTRFGFATIKYKGGVAPPTDDIATIRALRSAFPDVPLRLDPNATWTVATSLAVAAALRDCRLEWLEDPTAGPEGMAEVTRRGGLPTATNMCLTHAGEFARAAAIRAVDVVLCDLWYAGGLRAALHLAALCGAFGVGVGVHSQGETGVGLSAILHLAAALPTLVHAADAHYHDLTDDVITDGPLPVKAGAMAVPTAPGLGVRLDPERLARAAERHRETASRRAARAPDPTRPDRFPTSPAW